MYLEWGVLGDTMVIEVSRDRSVTFVFDVVKMCAKSFDNCVFGFAYILYLTNIARYSVH